MTAQISYGHILSRMRKTRFKSAQMARHGYDAICAHNLFVIYHTDKLTTDSRTLVYDEKMCECAQISYEKCDKYMNIHIKNMNDVDFDANINCDICMKVMTLFIDIKLRVVYKYIYLYHAYCYLHHLCA